MSLEIIYQDEQLVAINKPHDLLVHRSRLANDAEVFALQMLRNQLDRYVYPVHRLDRKTGGVLLFGFNEDIHKVMQKEFAERKVKKTYLAIVRGYTEDRGSIDYPLKKENGNLQKALTEFVTLDRIELDLPFGNHNTSRYSLVQINPQTGRKHQIRRHMAHIRYPIIADRPHGCNKQNKLFKEKFSLMTMMLHALELQFVHPASGEHVRIGAKPQSEMMRMIRKLGFRNLPDVFF